MQLSSLRSLTTLTVLTATLSLGAQGVEGETTGNSGTEPLAGSYQQFGTPCNSSGLGYGAPIALPQSLATSFGNSNNNIPFSWRPTRYQQVFLGTELGSPGVLVAMGLRQDNAFNSRTGHKVEFEMWLGGTTFDHSTVTSTFDNNFNSTGATKTAIFKRRDYSMPQFPPQNPTNPNDYFIKFPFDAPWVNNLGNDNLLIEVINHGNSNSNNLFTYPLDAGSGMNTTRIYASGNPGATTGTIGRNYGHVMAFFSIGTNDPAAPILRNSNLPTLGTDFHFEVTRGRPNGQGILLAGASKTSHGSLTLPFDMTPIGAPGCSLYVSMDVLIPVTLGPGGDLANTFSIPSNSALGGANVHIQYALLDGANALGVVMSDAGTLTLNP